MALISRQLNIFFNPSITRRMYALHVKFLSL